MTRMRLIFTDQISIDPSDPCPVMILSSTPYSPNFSLRELDIIENRERREAENSLLLALRYAQVFYRRN